MLPIAVVTTKFFIDVKLRQARAIDNPHDYRDFDTLEALAEFAQLYRVHEGGDLKPLPLAKAEARARTLRDGKTSVVCRLDGQPVFLYVLTPNGVRQRRASSSTK